MTKQSLLFLSVSRNEWVQHRGCYWIFQDCKTICFKSDADDYFLKTYYCWNFFQKNRSLGLFHEASFAWSFSLSLCCRIILSVRFEPMISCRNVIKLVKYDLWFTHVEVALTNRLNFFPFFIFADLFPPTDRIWNFWLSRIIFLI